MEDEAIFLLLGTELSLVACQFSISHPLAPVCVPTLLSVVTHSLLMQYGGRK